MTYLSRQIAFAATYVTIAGGLWVASQWWEKFLATNLSAPVISPGGCYRVETLKPFWALPSLLQPVQDPNEEGSTKWFQLWGYPGFYKLYDHRSGKLIGMSSVYDLQYTSGPLYWGSKSFPEVSAGAIYIGPNVPDCIGDRPMPRNSAN
jgi:hypothetical protein